MTIKFDKIEPGLILLDILTQRQRLDFSATLREDLDLRHSNIEYAVLAPRRKGRVH